MKLLIAIPSKNRVDILHKNTWAWAKHLGFDVKVFVEPQDYDLYSEKHFWFGMITQLDKDNQGLCYAKKFIQKYAEENGYDLVFKLDDDTKGFTDYRTKIKDPFDVADMMKKTIVNLVKEFENNPDLGAVAFPYSFHMFDKKTWSPVKKVQSSYIVRTELLCPPYPFSVFEDFAVGLYVMLKNKKVMKYGLVGQEVGVKVGAGTGGLQDFNREKLALEEAELLRKMYPPIKFKRVDKPWKIEPDVRSIKL